MIIHRHHAASRPRRIGLPALDQLGGNPLSRRLGRLLDDEHHLFRHVAPGGIPPLEAVLVGPGGVFAISHGAEHGRFQKRNGHWYRWNGSTDSWIPWDGRPILAARLAGHQLALYLERAGVGAPVTGCLIVGGRTEIGWEPDQRPGIAIFTELEALARRARDEDLLTRPQVDRIVALLDPRRPLPRLAPSAPGS